MANDTVIAVDDACFSYGAAPVLDHVSLTVHEGDFLGIVGPNGGGKTTLLRLMLGLLKPSPGTVTLFGGQPERTRHLAGYVPQFSLTDHTFPVTVEDVVAMGTMNARSLFPRWPGASREAIRGALAAVDIEPLADVPFGALSGGQRQRCLIARALAGKPRLLMLDEPTASVDNTVEAGFFELLRELNKRMTVILVSHDIGFISTYVTRVACVNHKLMCQNIGDLDIDTLTGTAYPNGTALLHHRCGL